MDGEGQTSHRRLGQVLKRHRESRNWTQVELGERAGIPQAQISNWERATRSVPTLDDIAAFETAFELPRGALLIESGYVAMPTSTREMLTIDPALTPERREIVLDLYDAQARRSAVELGDAVGRSTAASTSPTAATRRRKSSNS